jgi:hypothetical protein
MRTRNRLSLRSPAPSQTARGDGVGMFYGVALWIRARRWSFVSALTVCCFIWPALALAGFGDTGPPDLLTPQGEISITRTTDLATDRSFLDTTWVTCAGDGDAPSCVVKRTSGGRTTLIWMSGSDLQPSRYQLVGSDGLVETQIDFCRESLRIATKGESDTLIVPTSGPTHNGSTLIQCLRALAGRSNSGRLEMKLLVSRGQNTVRIIDVYAQRICEEDVVVPGGIFRCAKIEFGVAGIIGKMFWRTKYYYFYTAEAPYHFVKYLDPDGECIELVHYTCADGAITPAGD